MLSSAQLRLPCAHGHQALSVWRLNLNACAQRVVETPRVVEYERPQVTPGRYVRSYRSPGVQCVLSPLEEVLSS